MFPAAELADTTNLALGDRQKGISGAVPKDQFLHVGGFDFAPVVDNRCRSSLISTCDMYRVPWSISAKPRETKMSLSRAARRMRRISSESTSAFSR